MKDRRKRALLAGWLGTILLISFYVAIGRITALSFLLWVALMGGVCAVLLRRFIPNQMVFRASCVCNYRRRGRHAGRIGIDAEPAMLRMGSRQDTSPPNGSCRVTVR